MLMLSRYIRLCSSSICKESSFSQRRYLLSLVRHLFDQFPHRDVLQVFYPLLGSSACQKRLEKKNFSVAAFAKQADAHEVLESLHRTNALGTKLSRLFLCAALNSCIKTQNWNLGLQVHAHVIKSGYVDNLFLSSALVDLYAKFGAILDARKVFDGMRLHDQVSWTSMISGLSQNGYGKEAILLFKDMLGNSPVRPNCHTYVSVISALTELEEEFECIKTFHAHVIKLGFNSNSFLVSSLVDCYSKCGRIDIAEFLFNETEDRDDILFNSLISGYCFNLCYKEGLRLLVAMRKEKLRPSHHALTSALNASGSMALLREGEELHALVIKSSSESNVYVASALIDMYSKCGSVDYARKVFDQMAKRNCILWTSMIMGCARSGRGLDALELFNLLVDKEGCKPDRVCFTAVLTACVHAGFIEKGVEYFDKFRREYRIVPEIDHYACLVDLHARNGHLRKAKELMEEMPYKPNHVMWSSFLSSCRVYGEVELAKEAARMILMTEPEDTPSCIVLANAYAGAGLWDEVADIRKSMQRKGIKKNASGTSLV